MKPSFSQMSTPPSGPPPSGFVAPPPGYGTPPKKSTATVVLIVLAVVFGGGFFLIAILAAILFPVFAKVRGNARTSTCISNVEQIDLGLTMYSQDHDGKFPVGDYKIALMRYTQYSQNEKLFHCPADNDSADADASSSYAFNSKLQGVSLEEVSYPRDTVSVYEGKNQTLEFRHERTGGNVAVIGFVDGHVSAIRQDQVQTLRWKP